jgi:hypothetical protein
MPLLLRNKPSFFCSETNHADKAWLISKQIKLVLVSLADKDWLVSKQIKLG